MKIKKAVEDEKEMTSQKQIDVIAVPKCSNAEKLKAE